MKLKARILRRQSKPERRILKRDVTKPTISRSVARSSERNDKLMKNTCFSTGLFKEGLRQTRGVGISFVALCCVGGFFDILDILRIADSGSERTFRWASSSGATFGYIAIYLAAPMMALMLFHFLNSRRASDFYHSIPRTRTSLYISFSAAIITWIFAGLFVTFAGPMTTAAMTQIAGISWQEWFAFLLNSAVSVLLSLSAALLAVSLTSTVFIQLVTTQLILFLPQGLLSILVRMVRQNAPILSPSGSQLGFLIDGNPNLVFSSLFDSWHYSIGPALYTLALGALYFMLGMLAFVRRPSEAATGAASNRGVQGVIRVLVAFVPCLFAVEEICSFILRGRPFDPESIILVYSIAIIVYFLFEVLTARGFSTLKKTLPELFVGLGALALINIAFVVMPVMTVNNLMDFRPAPNDVASISVLGNANRSYYNYTPSYEMLRIPKAELTDSAIIETASAELNKNIDSLKAMKRINDYYDLVNLEYKMTDGSSESRQVYFSYDALNSFNQALLKNEAYREAILGFPADETITSLRMTSPLTDEQVRSIYDTLKAELGELPVDVKEVILDDSIVSAISASTMQTVSTDGMSMAESEKYLSKYLSDNASYDQLVVEGVYDGKKFSSTYNIGIFTPKTLNLYVKYINFMNGTTAAQKLDSFFNSGLINAFGWSEMYVTGSLVQLTDGRYVDTGSDVRTFDDPEDYKAGSDPLIDELIANAGRFVDVSKPYYCVSFSKNVVAENGNMYYEDCTVFIQAGITHPVLYDWVDVRYQELLP